MKLIKKNTGVFIPHIAVNPFGFSFRASAGHGAVIGKVYEKLNEKETLSYKLFDIVNNTFIEMEEYVIDAIINSKKITP